MTKVISTVKSALSKAAVLAKPASKPKPPKQAKPPSPEAFRSWLSVVRAYNQCDAVLSQRLAPLGIRVAEHEVLANLLRSPGITQQELASRCFAAKSGISVLLKRMEEQELVRRDADASDARAKRLNLTASGEALARQSIAIQGEVITVMESELTRAELLSTQEVMDRLAARLAAMIA